MKLTAQEDIEAPIDRVFATLTEFDQLERAALRRGIDVRQTGPHDSPVAVPGMGWLATFRFRGRSRSAEVTLTKVEPPQLLQFDSRSGGLDVISVVDLVALSRARTRVGLTVELVPRALSARLLVQSLKIARGNVQRKFSARVAEMATEIERRAK